MDSDLDTSSSDEEQQYRLYRPRVNFHSSKNYREYLERFRQPDVVIDFLLKEIGDVLVRRTNRNKPLSPKVQILTMLHFLGCGAPYHVIGDCHGIHKTSVMRCVHAVADAIHTRLFSKEVCWPENCQGLSERFKEIAGFPNVAGIIDGTLIPILAPSTNEKAYVDRKGRHSLNVLVVCGPQRQFYYALANYPGSVHDSRILSLSSLANEWDAGWRPFSNAVILGDSGFSQRSWLMTPNVSPDVPEDAAQKYIRAHTTTRQLVECSLGVLKEKFPALNGFRLAPKKAAKLILAAITVHNIGIRLEEGEVTRHQDNLVEFPENASRFQVQRLLINYINQ